MQSCTIPHLSFTCIEQLLSKNGECIDKTMYFLKCLVEVVFLISTWCKAICCPVGLLNRLYCQCVWWGHCRIRQYDTGHWVMRFGCMSIVGWEGRKGKRLNKYTIQKLCVQCNWAFYKRRQTRIENLAMKWMLKYFTCSYIL